MSRRLNTRSNKLKGCMKKSRAKTKPCLSSLNKDYTWTHKALSRNKQRLVGDTLIGNVWKERKMFLCILYKI